ncbi:hypothetical protein [Ligilactobacillus animalis]|uniref:hypothetical protein n=1 Tax=Ligilactobacillus animalis TaxID=1605 RepID=UPI000826A145|nr:hypothetical protein [Ligilactobacillus animalis]OCX47788.1 hypothetical protein BFC98_06075 [Ligilactobacillus animalis]QHQ70143.1 hypothetical protein GSR62_05245 [Ligilactobacillus animalis]
MELKTKTSTNNDVYAVLTFFDSPAPDSDELATDISLLGAFHTKKEAQEYVKKAIERLNYEVDDDLYSESDFFIKQLKGVAPNDQIIVSAGDLDEE